MNQITDNGLGRRVPTDTELEAMVLAAVKPLVGQQFTAYTVTKLIRTNNPSDEIAHDRVRTLVHNAMRAPMANGTYDTRHERFATGTAILYAPVTQALPTITVTPSVAQQPAQLPSRASTLLLPLPGDTTGQ
jgi:hypothetical protein